jgi:hypothetical protein
MKKNTKKNTEVTSSGAASPVRFAPRDLRWTRGYRDVHCVVSAAGLPVRAFAQRDLARGWILANICDECKLGKPDECNCTKSYDVVPVRMNGGDQSLPVLIKAWVIIDPDGKPYQIFVDREESKSVKRNLRPQGYSRGSIIVENLELPSDE